MLDDRAERRGPPGEAADPPNLSNPRRLAPFAVARASRRAAAARGRRK